MFDNIKVTSGKRKVSLGNVASIQNKDDKYILDLTSSPNVSQSFIDFFEYFAKQLSLLHLGQFWCLDIMFQEPLKSHKNDQIGIHS